VIYTHNIRREKETCTQINKTVFNGKGIIMSVATLKGIAKEVVFISSDRIRATYGNGSFHELKIVNGKLEINDHNWNVIFRNGGK
jgi:hypothetical protein